MVPFVFAKQLLVSSSCIVGGLFWQKLLCKHASVIVHVVSFASGLLGNQSNTHTHNDNVIIGVMVCGNVCYCIRWWGAKNQNHGPKILRTGGGGVPVPPDI